ncbi:MAG TPA: hypothetical protein VNB24_08910 [Acidimicrobiales bacterium]|nr:hypothetical protein [Acidimicrobiales bacterium]
MSRNIRTAIAIAIAIASVTGVGAFQSPAAADPVTEVAELVAQGDAALPQPGSYDATDPSCQPHSTGCGPFTRPGGCVAITPFPNGECRYRSLGGVQVYYQLGDFNWNLSYFDELGNRIFLDTHKVVDEQFTESGWFLAPPGVTVFLNVIGGLGVLGAGAPHTVGALRVPPRLPVG